MNMKNILRLMGALTLTTMATTSVVSCGCSNKATGVKMNAEVSKQLGLTDNQGQGVEKLNLAVNTNENKAEWNIDALKTPITANKLLIDPTKDSAAANESCANFITNVLKLNMTGEKFSKSELEAITGKITNITPKLAKNSDGNDYVVTSGSFSFQFINNQNRALGDIYAINLKVKEAQGIVNQALRQIVNSINVADTDAATKLNFKVGSNIPANDLIGTRIQFTGNSAAVQQFKSLCNLTNLTINAQVGEVNKINQNATNWAANDKIKIVFTSSDNVNFTADKEINPES